MLPFWLSLAISAASMACGGCLLIQEIRTELITNQNNFFFQWLSHLSVPLIISDSGHGRKVASAQAKHVKLELTEFRIHGDCNGISLDQPGHGSKMCATKRSSRPNLDRWLTWDSWLKYVFCDTWDEVIYGHKWTLLAHSFRKIRTLKQLLGPIHMPRSF